MRLKSFASAERGNHPRSASLRRRSHTTPARPGERQHGESARSFGPQPLSLSSRAACRTGRTSGRRRLSRRLPYQRTPPTSAATMDRRRRQPQRQSGSRSTDSWTQAFLVRGGPGRAERLGRCRRKGSPRFRNTPNGCTSDASTRTSRRRLARRQRTLQSLRVRQIGRPPNPRARRSLRLASQSLYEGWVLEVGAARGGEATAGPLA